MYICIHKIIQRYRWLHSWIWNIEFWLVVTVPWTFSITKHDCARVPKLNRSLVARIPPLRAVVLAYFAFLYTFPIFRTYPVLLRFRTCWLAKYPMPDQPRIVRNVSFPHSICTLMTRVSELGYERLKDHYCFRNFLQLSFFFSVCERIAVYYLQFPHNRRIFWWLFRIKCA